MKICLICDAKYDDAATFCEKDGSRLEELKQPVLEEKPEVSMSCPICGRLYEAADVFCEADGTRLVPVSKSAARVKDERTDSAPASGLPLPSRDIPVKSKPNIPVILSIAALIFACFAGGFFLVPRIVDRLSGKPGEVLVAEDNETAPVIETEVIQTPLTAESAQTVPSVAGNAQGMVSEDFESNEQMEVSDSAIVPFNEVADANEPELVDVPEEEVKSFITELDFAQTDALIREITDKANVAYAVVDLKSGMVHANDSDRPTSSSVLIDVPILYTAMKKIDAGELDRDAEVPFRYEVGGRGTLTASDNGRKYPMQEMLGYMFRNSDNNATNSMMDYLGLNEINRVCHENGYDSVQAVNKIGKTQDYTANDNYISAKDLCGMLLEIYQSDSPLGWEFFRGVGIADGTERGGLGKDVRAGDAYISFNGLKDKKYNEFMLVVENETAYAAAFLSNGDNYQTLQKAAAALGGYIHKTATEY